MDSLLSSMADFVPCDRQLQRAHDALLMQIARNRRLGKKKKEGAKDIKKRRNKGDPDTDLDPCPGPTPRLHLTDTLLLIYQEVLQTRLNMRATFMR